MELMGCDVRVAARELSICQCMPPTCRRGECQGRTLEEEFTLLAGDTVRVTEMSTISWRSQGDAAAIPRKSVLDGSKWCSRASRCRLAAACRHGPSARKCSRRKYSSPKSTCKRTCVGRKPSTCDQDARAICRPWSGKAHSVRQCPVRIGVLSCRTAYVACLLTSMGSFHLGGLHTASACPSSLRAEMWFGTLCPPRLRHPRELAVPVPFSVEMSVGPEHCWSIRLAKNRLPMRREFRIYRRIG